MEKRVLFGEVMLPCILMVIMEGCTIGLTILASTVIAKGISPFVLLFYINALSSIILLPYSFFFAQTDRSREQPLFTLPLLLRLFLLGLTGITISQNLAFVGLSYSSPILVCGMANLIPSFSFILSLFLRRTKFDLRSPSIQARLIGTLISIMGAISITFYKGPVIKHAPSTQLQFAPRLLIFASTNQHWVLGAILLAAASLSVSIWNTIQVGTMKLYSEVMIIVSCYSLFGTIQSAVLCIFIERDPSAWRLKINMELIVIVLTAIFGSIIRSRVHMWCLRMKGPFYVPAFKPLGIPIASMCGCLFFADTFHYGSIMGASIVGVGYYTVLWGQMREETNGKGGRENLSEEKIPLLQEEDQV